MLEVFGEHTLGVVEVSALALLAAALLAAYVVHATHSLHPLLRLGLLRIRTLRAALSGSFVTRLGIGGMPFLLPLLYQVGLGFSPIQSGLLILPQSVTALAMKMSMPKILTRFGYRRVLVTNTLLLGGLIAVFATVNQQTPIWLICVQAMAFGFLSSMQYTSMNTLVYADVGEGDASMASTIASTVQQMSMSFGVAAASLVTALFIPDRFHSDATQLIGGVHRAFLLLGALTVASTIVFRRLRPDDGNNVSRPQARPRRRFGGCDRGGALAHAAWDCPAVTRRARARRAPFRKSTTPFGAPRWLCYTL